MTADAMNRRIWMASAVLATTGVHRLAQGFAAEKPTIGIGFSLYGLPKQSLDEALELCASHGYDSVELALMPGLACEPKLIDVSGRKQLRDKLAKRGIVVAGLMENLPVTIDDDKHRAQLERIKAAAELAHSLAPDVPPPLETIVGGKPGEWDQLKSLMVDRIGSWAEAARQARLVVCIKPHAGGALNRPDDALWLIRQVNSPWLRLVYDYSHYEHRGFSMADTMHDLVPLAPFVHVKDRAADTSRLQFLLPGDGQIDYRQFARLLAAQSYRGHVVVEVSAQIHSKPDYDPQKSVARCYQVLSQAWQAAGISRPARGK